MRGATLLLMGSAVVGIASIARSQTYALPEESVPVSLSGPGAEIVVNNCSGCHSLDYISTQPHGKGVQFWRDSVKKMITVYGAPVAPEDIEPISIALDKSHSPPG